MILADWMFPDVLIQFGFGHVRRRIRFDALGRPLVWTLGEAHPLSKDGWAGQKRWVPLSSRAATIYRGDPE